VDLLTYAFEGSYVNRQKDKSFIKNILSTFNRNEITGVGINVNNNPWSFEVFIFITIDTNYLKREKFTEWLKQFDDKYSLHNIFLSKGGNMVTLSNQDILIYFDRLFIFSELEAKLFTRYKELPTLFFGERSAFETKHPQYKNVKYETPAIFISHSSLDKDKIALPISDYLCAKEIPIWLDRNEMMLENNSSEKVIYEKIRHGISICKTGVFIVTSNFIEKSKWTKVELSICKELGKNILLLIFDENEERVEKLKNDYSLDDSSIVLMNGIEGNYETIRKKLLEDNFV
jgi:MTH538 TIR-like domain (DUF1863).